MVGALAVGWRNYLDGLEMELLEPVFVSDHQFSVVGPTSLDEMVAAQFLNGYLALWHPAIIVRAAVLPKIVAELDVSNAFAKKLALVEVNSVWERVSLQLQGELVEKGWAFKAGDSDLMRKIAEKIDLQSESKPDIWQRNSENWSAFKGLGLGLAWVDAIFEAQNHTNLLDRDGFLAKCRGAADAWIDGNEEQLRSKLTEAAAILTYAREQVISGTPRIIESFDWDNSDFNFTLGLPAGFDYGLKTVILASGKTLETVEKERPELLLKLQSSQDLIQVCGGRYIVRNDGLFPIASQLWNLREGQKIHKRIFGECSVVVVHPGNDLHPALPSMWRQAAFSHAILRLPNGLGEEVDSGCLAKKTRVSLVSWSSGDGMGVETLVCQPLQGASNRACIDLAYHFQRSQSIDYCPILHLRSTTQNALGWFGNFLSLCQLSPVLGEHYFASEVLSNASPGDYWSAATAEEMMPDPGEFPPEVIALPADQNDRLKRQALQASWSYVSILASLEGAQTVGKINGPNWAEAVGKIRAAELDWEMGFGNTRNQPAIDPVSLGGELLAKRLIAKGKSGLPGWMVLNPCAFMRRGVIQVPGHKMYNLEGPVKACQVEPEGKVSLVVEVPPYGFCWLPVEGGGEKQTTQNRLRLADDRGVRNEFLEADIDPSTGEIRTVRDARSRRPRISVQIVGGSGTAMVLKKSAVISSGPARGELETVGELVDGSGNKTGEFCLRLKAWVGRPVLEIAAKIEMNSGHSDQSHVLRVVWRDPSMDLRRGWMGQTLRLKEGLQLSGEWVEIAEGRQSTTTVLPIDFPLCKKHGKRSLDFLFGNGGVPNGEFNKLGVALDRDYPFLLSQGLESPLSCIAVDKGPPPSGASGWLGMFDHSDVLITDLRPGEIGAKPALIWQLISTAKEGFELGLNLAKSPLWGAVADLVEQEQRSINLEDGGAKAFIQRLEWAGLVIGLGEQ